MDEFENYTTSTRWDAFEDVDLNLDFSIYSTSCNTLTEPTNFNYIVDPITFNSTDNNPNLGFQPRKISPAQWEKVKDVIHEQYIIQKCSLNDLVSYMEREHSFFASKPQYVRKLSKWKFEKYKKRQVWSGTDRALKRRRLKIDDAHIYFEGRFVPSKKLKKEISRHDRPSLREKYLSDSASRDASPQTPDGLIVRRHNADSVQVSPPGRLPWFDFLDRLANLSSVLKPDSQVPVRQYALFPYTPSNRYSLLTRIFRSNETGSSICHQGNAGHLAVQLARRLSPVLIERTSGDVEDAFMKMSTTQDPLKMCVLITAYVVWLCTNRLAEVSTLPTYVSMLKDHELGSLFLGQLLDSDDPTTQIFMNHLLLHSVKTMDFWLLQRIAPRILNIDTKLPYYQPCSALCIAIESGDSDAARFLLSSGSDPDQCLCESEYFNRCQQENCLRPIDLAAKSQKSIELVDDLLDRGARFNRKRIIDLAIRHGANTQLVTRLVKAGASLQVSAELEKSRKLGAHVAVYRNPLTAAISSGRSDIVQQLIHDHHLSPNARDAFDRETADELDFYCPDDEPLCFISPLIRAIMLRKKDMADFLITAGADIGKCLCQHLNLKFQFLNDSRCETPWTVCDSELDELGKCVFSPLQAAAYVEDEDLVRRLVNLGACLEPCHGISALKHSLFAGNRDMTESLLELGADPDAIKTGMFHIAPLMIAVAKDDVAMVELLLRYGADVSLQSETFDGQRTLVRLYVSQCEERVRTLAESNTKRYSATNGDHCCSIPNFPSIEYADPSSIMLSGLPSDYWSVSPELFETVLKDPHGTNLLEVCLKGGSDPSGPICGNCCSPLELILDHVCCWRDDTEELLKRVSLLLRYGGKIGLTEFSRILTREPDIWLGIMKQVLLLPGCLDNSLRTHIPEIRDAIRLNDAGRLHQIALVALRAMKKQNPAFKISQALCHVLYVSGFVGTFVEETVRSLFEDGSYINSLIDTKLVPLWSEMFPESLFSDKFVTPLHLLLGWNPKSKHEDFCLARLRVLRFLIDAGSDINRAAVDSIGIERWTPLQLLFNAGGCFDEIRCLVEAGADVNAPASSFWGDRAPLQEAVEKGDSEVVEYLISKGADVNAPASTDASTGVTTGGTALQYAARGDYLNIMQVLLEAGADVNAPAPSSGWGSTALQEAADRGNLEAVEYLITKGADVNAPAGAYRGATALQYAAGKGHFRVMQILLEAGADIDAPGAEIEGRTAIEIAAENGRIDYLYHLLDKYEGQTPISEVCEEAAEYARKQGHHVMADFLDKYSSEKDAGQQCAI